MTKEDISAITSPESSSEVDVLVLGAGLTGLSVAYYLSEAGKRVRVVDTASEAGGSMKTLRIDDFVLESGPNTGVLSSVALVELIKSLGLEDHLQIANPSAKRRLILKAGRLHALPSGLGSAITTPLFTCLDKLRILFEPWRRKGDNPNESVAHIVRRRLGASFYDYAVNPFIGGIYAGDPETLVTRYALPKLYALEQGYGSFVRGAIALRRSPKSERERQVTKEVFSLRGGFSTLIQALVNRVGDEHITLGVQKPSLIPSLGGWQYRYCRGDVEQEIRTSQVVSAIPAYALPEILRFAPADTMKRLSDVRYAPVVQVVLGYRDSSGLDFEAFGALMPSIEEQKLLGILNLSACFFGRAPSGGALLSCFLGGSRSPELIDASDEELTRICLDRIKDYFSFVHTPDLVRIFRHRRAIPQYEESTEGRLRAAQELHELYPTLLLGGNALDGIGIADRVKQADMLARRVLEDK